MRVLILGAKGMLGHDLVQAFGGEDIVAWGRDNCDLTDEQMVNDRVTEAEPEVVVNAAAYTDVDRAEEESEEADAVNGFAVGSLAVTCSSLGIPLLHISTEAVFGQEKPDGYRETDEPLRPLAAYGRSKLLGETLLKENTEHYWLVRTAWLFGVHGKNFLTRIAAAAQGKDSIPVVDDVVGSPTYTADLARAIRSLITDRAPYGIYHLVNHGQATRADFAEEYLQCTGSPTKVERVPSSKFPQKASRQKISILHNTKRPPLPRWQEAVAAYAQASKHA